MLKLKNGKFERVATLSLGKDIKENFVLLDPNYEHKNKVKVVLILLLIAILFMLYKIW